MAVMNSQVCNFGWKAVDFELRGVDDKLYRLADVRGSKATLVMFICNHCPYVKGQIERIVQDARALAPLGVGTIASPLLDNVSIAGSTGVLVNITGGSDLTLGEVTQISEIIHDSAGGEQAEIIFGAVQDPAMQGEVRVTVIATGFDKPPAEQASPFAHGVTSGVLPFPQHASRPSRSPARGAPGTPTPPRTAEGEVSEMEIPTFIRRQMD